MFLLATGRVEYATPPDAPCRYHVATTVRLIHVLTAVHGHTRLSFCCTTSDNCFCALGGRYSEETTLFPPSPRGVRLLGSFEGSSSLQYSYFRRTSGISASWPVHTRPWSGRLNSSELSDLDLQDALQSGRAGRRGARVRLRSPLEGAFPLQYFGRHGSLLLGSFQMQILGSSWMITCSSMFCVISPVEVCSWKIWSATGVTTSSTLPSKMRTARNFHDVCMTAFLKSFWWCELGRCTGSPTTWGTGPTSILSETLSRGITSTTSAVCSGLEVLAPHQVCPLQTARKFVPAETP